MASEPNTTFPLPPADRSHAYKLIADYWIKKGNRPMAIFYYRRAIETDLTSRNARSKFDGLEGGSR